MYLQDFQLSGKDWNVRLNALSTMFQQKRCKLSDTSKLKSIVLITLNLLYYLENSRTVEVIM